MADITINNSEVTGRDVICIDVSGSTCGSTSYWEKVRSVLTEKYNQNPSIQIVLWNQDAAIADYNLTMRVVDNRGNGYGGTEPYSFVKFLNQNDNLILITDGQVSVDSVNKCTQEMSKPGKQLNKVNVLFVGPENSTNLSVAVPFTREAKEYSMTLNNEQIDTGSVKDRIDLTNYYNNPELFIAEYDTLYKKVTLKCMARRDDELRTNILDLQTNLMSCISQRNTPQVGFRQHVGNIESFRNALSFNDTAFTPEKQIQLFIGELLKQCDNNTNFSFDQLRKPSLLVRSKQTKPVLIEELPDSINITDYECPVLMDDDSSPCLLVNVGEPVLANIDAGYLKKLIIWPFLLLDNTELIEKVKARLDHPVSLSAAKQLDKSPFTRQPISCVIPLDNETNDSVHKALVYSLGKIFFGDKLAGNTSSWLSVIYFIVKGFDHSLKLNKDKNLGISYLSNIVPNLELRLKQVMTTSKINLTMTGLPIAPMIKDYYDVALWYTVYSGLILNVDADEKNRLRSLGPSGRFIINLVKVNGHNIDGAILHKYKVYNAFNYMMKAAQQEHNSFNNWRLVLRAQYQNSLVLSDGSIIMLDGPTSNQVNPKPNVPLPDRYYDLSLNTLLGLATLVDKTKTAGTIVFPNSIDVPIPNHVNNYGYDGNTKATEIPICPKTMRPYTVDIRDGKFWEDRAVEVYNCPLAKQLSMYNYYIEFVQSKGVYPEKEEYIKFLSEKQRMRLVPVDTLPDNLSEFTDSVLEDYKPVISNVAPIVFAHLSELSRSRDERRTMESAE